MQELNLPHYEFKLKPGPNGPMIFDSIRKKFLILTPEEWVRQNYIEYLNQEFGYPKSLMTLEQPMKYNRMDKRSDIVCYGNGGEPLLIVECKRPSVKITQKTFDQIARYNMVLKVPYLAVTNGLNHFYCKVNHKLKTYEFIKLPPDYLKLI